MAKVILYFLESSALLAFFYLLYLVVLKRETFFSINRFFLIGSLVFSLLFPLVSIDFSANGVAVVERPVEEISKWRMTYYEAMASWEFEGYAAAKQLGKGGFDPQQPTSSLDWVNILFAGVAVVYVLGALIFLSKTAWTLTRIRKMIATYPQEKTEGVTVVKLPFLTAPFSFLQYVFVHDALLGTADFGQILAHEKTHIRQRHSIDLLFVQLLAAFLWFNPVVWQLLKSLKTTHEYIADKKIIHSGYSLVEYQTLLLKQLISNNSLGLVHNFNLSFIKKRITMMTNKQSGWSGKVKVAMTLVGAVLFSVIVVQCNSRIDDQVVAESGPAVATTDDFGVAVNLPVVPDNGYTFDGNVFAKKKQADDFRVVPDNRHTVDGNTVDALNFNIADDKLRINGKAYKVSEIASVLSEAKLSDQGMIIMRVDKDQPMKLVRDVQTELRKADRRKVFYVGQTLSGKSFEMPFLLPPTPENASRTGAPLQPDADQLEAEGKMDILKIEVSENAGPTSQQKVYDFVQSHMDKQSEAYVVSVRFSDEDTYGSYLLSLAHVKEGFHQIYHERARELFGKTFFEVSAEQGQQVRRGIPMAISVAE